MICIWQVKIQSEYSRYCNSSTDDHIYPNSIATYAQAQHLYPYQTKHKFLSAAVLLILSNSTIE